MALRPGVWAGTHDQWYAVIASSPAATPTAGARYSIRRVPPILRADPHWQAAEGCDSLTYRGSYRNRTSGEMTEAGSSKATQKIPTAVILGGARTPGRQSRAPSRQREMILLAVGISAVARLLGSRRFHVRVITAVIGLAALADMMRQSEIPVAVRVIFKDYFTGHVKELMEHGEEELKREELKRAERKRRHHRSSTTGSA